MITQTNAVTFRQNLGEMLNQVQYRHDSIVINKDGKPVAALIDNAKFERIRRMESRFDELCAKIAENFEAYRSATGKDEAAVMAEIDAAVHEVRHSPSK